MLQRRGALDQARIDVFESGLFVDGDEFLWRRIPVGGVSRRAETAQDQLLVERFAQPCEVSSTAHLTCETPAGLQREPDRARRPLLVEYPVQRRVGKGRVERLAEFQLRRIH